MPSLTTTVEDSSPFLRYTGIWMGGSSEDDYADQYSESSFTVTNTPGASVSWSFYGTAVNIYGARRVNHGPFEVTIDGKLFPTVNAQSNTFEFSQPLLSAVLDDGLHAVELTNPGATFRDIDWVSWETVVGGADEELITNMIPYSHPSWKYEPAEFWNIRPPFLGLATKGNARATEHFNATARLSFKGDVIALYGPVGPGYTSGYSIQVDDGDPVLFSPMKNRAQYRSKQLLYWQGNLGNGDHTLAITLSSRASNEVLAIEYAEVFTTSSLGGAFLTVDGVIVESPPSNLKNATDTATTTPPLGLIIATSVTSFLAFLALSVLFAAFVFYKKGRFHFGHIPKPPLSPPPPGPSVMQNSRDPSSTSNITPFRSPRLHQESDVATAGGSNTRVDLVYPIAIKSHLNDQSQSQPQDRVHSPSANTMLGGASTSTGSNSALIAAPRAQYLDGRDSSRVGSPPPAY